MLALATLILTSPHLSCGAIGILGNQAAHQIALVPQVSHRPPLVATGALAPVLVLATPIWVTPVHQPINVRSDRSLVMEAVLKLPQMPAVELAVIVELVFVTVQVLAQQVLSPQYASPEEPPAMAPWDFLCT